MNNRLPGVFTFFGCCHRAGTTMIAHETAKIISKQMKGSRVLFLALNGHDYVSYSKSVQSSIEDLKIKVDNNLITSEDVLNFAERDEDLYIIRGVKGLFTHRYYSPQFPEKLIKKSKEVFDYIIIDSGNELDSGLCVGALQSCENMVMVLNQTESCIMRAKEYESIFQSLELRFSYYVINRYNPDDPYDISYFRSFFRKEDKAAFFTIRNEAGYSRLAEMDRMLISSYKCSGYIREVRDFTAELLKGDGFMDTDMDSKKKRFFGLM